MMHIRHSFSATIVLLLLASSAAAQLPLTRLKAVYPPGGQVGTTFELKLTAGDDLEEVTALHFTHPGITAKPRMQEVEGQPQPVENTFDVTIAGDVPAGIHEVRASGLWGVSNPQRFAVSARKHAADTEPNNTMEQAQAVELNSSVTGRMDGGTDIDVFKFSAEAGQRVVIDCLSERLDSQMDPDLVMRDAQGRRFRWARNTLGDDPTLVFDVETSGEYFLDVHDHIYRNGQENVYRLDLHTGPHIAFVMPPAGQAGTKSKFTLFGYNLPGGTKSETLLNKAVLEQLVVEIDVPREEAIQSIQNVVRSFESDVDAFTWALDTPQGRSNPVRIGISGHAALLEAEPNSEPAQAQSIAAPGEAAGQLATERDVDWYAFPGKPGEVYWIEVIGQRNGNTLDPVLVVEQVTKDSSGAEQVKRLTQQDDDGTNVAPNVFDTFTDDPVYRVACDQEATYRVAVYDRYGSSRGDPNLRYRLCIRGEEPDFRVVAVPAQVGNNTGAVWPVGLRKGDSVGVPIYALRKFGYDGPIQVTVDGLPAGVHCAGTTIGSKETAGTLVFVSDENAAEVVANVRLISTAVIESPAARRRHDEAVKQRTEAEKALVDLRKKLDEATTKLQQSIAPRDDAAMKSLADPANAGLAADLAAKQKSVDAAQQGYLQASDAFATAEQGAADARLAVERATAALPVGTIHRRHLVRTGTLMSGGTNNVPAEGRLAQSFVIAVMKEVAPFQLQSQSQRITACQSRQILIPVQLVRRNGFDDKVQLTIAGVPKSSNIQAANIAIEKGAGEGLVAILIKENTPPGTYTITAAASGQVSYSRNPEKTARIKAERDEVAKRLEQAQATAKAAADAKNAAVQKATEAATRLQQTQKARQQADQLVAARTGELNNFKAQKEAAENAVAEKAKAVEAAEAAAAEAKQALNADAENADLKNKFTVAETALAEAQKQSATAIAARDEQAKRLTESEQALTAATNGQKTAVEAQTQAEAAKAEADKIKADAETAEKQAAEAVKPVDDKKKAADKRVADAEKASQPQNKNFTPQLQPVVIEVIPAPVKLSVNVPNGGAIKPGETLEITVKAERLNGFTGPIKLAVVPPPKVLGLTGAVEIPADGSEAKLTVSAAADATEGQHGNVVIQATADLNGPQLVDAPVTIKVAK